jgi:uroporphyrinogen III methyltransferase / synthase
VIFTSANAIAFLWEGLRSQGKDVRVIGAARIAAVGGETAAALARHGLHVDLTPEEATAEQLLARFPTEVAGAKILIPRAEEAPDLLPEGLRERGAEVRVLSVYRTLPETSGAEAVRDQLAGGEIDAVTFTSSSTVRNFRRVFPELPLEGTTVACIGPVTAATARALGIPVSIVAEDQSVRGLVQSLASHFGTADNTG